jgi:ribonuclease J
VTLQEFKEAVIDRPVLKDITQKTKTVLKRPYAELIYKTTSKAPAGLIYVDGFSVGTMQDVVLRDRQMLAQDGVFVSAILIDSRTGKLRKSPDIVSRGFVYLKESQELLRQVRLLIRKKIEDNAGKAKDGENEELRNELNDTVSKFFIKKTGKSPIVMSIIIYS